MKSKNSLFLKQVKDGLSTGSIRIVLLIAIVLSTTSCGNVIKLSDGFVSHVETSRRNRSHPGRVLKTRGIGPEVVVVIL